MNKDEREVVFWWKIEIEKLYFNNNGKATEEAEDLWESNTNEGDGQL